MNRTLLIQGDARHLPLADASVHCAVTSPPYWSLRDYGLEPSVWGGDSACAHEWRESRYYTEKSAGKSGAEAFSEPGAANAERLKKARWRTDSTCAKCGAWRGCLGLEPRPEMFVSHLVEIFREVRRVLRDDGTLWLNIGDSYATQGGRHGGRKDNQPGVGAARVHLAGAGDQNQRTPPAGTKHKDLVGIPWMLAFALRADGWYLRQEIIWAKPNPMPESVTDRCTKSHESLFLLTKNARYYYDADAIREPVTSTGGASFGKQDHDASGTMAQSRRLGSPEERNHPLGRNKRSVWFIPTQSCPEAHFATFPVKLVLPCIKAGTSEKGCCPACGAPWKRVVERRSNTIPVEDRTGRQSHNGRPPQQSGYYWKAADVLATTWVPTCRCAAGSDVRDGDLEIICTPTGERSAPDPSLVVGRAGFSRPRGESEGIAPITRYQQRKYADQLRASPHRAEMATETQSAFEHYVRTDRAGARAIPPELLSRWIDCGWLTQVEPPTHGPLSPIPCTVLDCFNGAATAGVAAESLGRSYIGIEPKAEYLEISRRRLDKAREKRAEKHGVRRRPVAVASAAIPTLFDASPDPRRWREGGAGD